jgi:hypothetical protein
MPLRRLTACIAMLAACGTRQPPEPSPDHTRDALVTLPVRAGSDVTVPIRLSPAGSVALQFDLEYDPKVLTLQGGTGSEAVKGGSKEMTVRRLGKGTARVVVFGFNLDPLPEGVLGEVRLRGLADARRTSIRATRRYAPDAGGQDLQTAITDGQIIVQGR